MRNKMLLVGGASAVLTLFAVVGVAEQKAKEACAEQHGRWEVVERIYMPPMTQVHTDGKGNVTTSVTPGYWLNEYGCVLPR